MPPIYYLNPPPNPFWDFVAGLEDHPFFTGPASGPHRHQPPPPPPARRSAAASATTPGAFPDPEPTTTTEPEMSEKARGKQATVEDPPEVDPSTVKPAANAQDTKEGRGPCRGRGRFANACEDGEGTDRRGRGGRACRGRGRAGWHGPPPFMMGSPFFPRPPWAPHDNSEHPHPPAPPHSGPEHRGPAAPAPPFGPPSAGPPHHGPPHHRHGPPPHARGPWGPWGPGRHRRHSPPHGDKPGFDLSEFLNRLGDKLGIDLSNAAEGLGLTADRFTAGRTNQETDFEPRSDIFENKDQYIIHLSLPGAKKPDIGVDYDGENSVLRITGVVHRPDVDEQMLSELVVDGRKRETGVFEKAVRLGTKREPASIDVAGITAKMTDGVLVVRIPKVEPSHQRREVPIAADPVEEGQANYEDEYSEKPVLFDAEEQERGIVHDKVHHEREPISLIDMKDNEPEPTPIDRKLEDKEKNIEADDKKAEAASEANRANEHNEQERLPAYTAEAEHSEEDWEKFSDVSNEGEYIKINVD